MRRYKFVPTALAAAFLATTTTCSTARALPPRALEERVLRAVSASPRIVREDARLDALLAPGTVLTKVADDFTWLEGPVWDRVSGSLYFSDIPRNVVMRWRPGEPAVPALSPAGYTGTAPFAGKEPGSNGLALDAEGRLVLCAHGDRQIVRIEKNGARTVLAARYRGKRLNSPNDLAFTRNGDLVFTDPPFGLPGWDKDPAKETPWSGVYRLAKDGSLALLTTELPHPNGLAFSPDESTLFVSNSDPERRRLQIVAYPVRRDGTLGKGRVFWEATPLAARGAGNPDGLKVDSAGNVFATGPGGLYVLSAAGAVLGYVDMGVPTSNLAWGEDGSVLYITASTSVYRLATLTRGARP